ncbi:hypothetical protein MUO56_05090, partial [Candidatus Bathyarchaeota archaeon]|nr:hypothetical protein [Candidatus Bathyarchaeota archaeon]
MLKNIARRLKRDKRGVSNVMVVMLSLVLIVIVVDNIVLWDYQMNQLDWERMQEKIEITAAVSEGTVSLFTIQNTGSQTAHLISLWILDNSITNHQRYDLNTFINAGDTFQLARSDIILPGTPYIVKI